MAETWHDIIKRKREQIKSTAPAAWQQLDDDPDDSSDIMFRIEAALSQAERSITAMHGDALLEALRHNRLTTQAVVSAFCHRAYLAHRYTQCVTEFLYDDAMAAARDLDAHWRARGAPLGPLHGLPVSLMDRFHLAGVDSACGFTAWVDHPRCTAEEGVLVQRLRQLGAVIICKTTVPMSTMIGETTSNIYGHTVCPHDRRYNAGGACGGEGALLACQGSALGFGTDVAGSCRIPSAFNGLWALKTSEGRLPNNGLASVLEGLPTQVGAIGLMSLARSSLNIAFAAILASQPWLQDWGTLQIPWRQPEYDDIMLRQGTTFGSDGSLVFGLMLSDGHIDPVAPIQQALQHVRTVLGARGHEIVEWNPPPHASAAETLFRIFGADDGTGIRRAIDQSGEPPIPQLKQWYNTSGTESSSTLEFWELCAARDRYRQQYAEYWERMDNATKSGRRIDGVILPVNNAAEIEENDQSYYAYSAIANIMDCAAGSFPVFLHRAGESPGSHVTAGTTLESQARLPIGLQVMCRRHHEERVLALLHVLDDALHH